jgi:sugar phosphate isomerase/epimerase
VKLAASNIAWPRDQDEAVAALLRRLGFEAVELAPTAIWPAPTEVSPSAAAEVRALWASHGLRISSLQALLFGHPELLIFGDDAAREATRRYLEKIIQLGGALGAEALVFGSPKNRARMGRSPEEAEEIAVRFFRELGRVAADAGTCLCLEPNPEIYGCDFITRVGEGLALVRRVDSPGFRLHLDSGGMTLAGEQVGPPLLEAMAAARHFHVSEPHLVPIGQGGADHAAMAGALRAAGYAHWCSVEMRAVPSLEALEQAWTVAKDCYASPAAGSSG